MTAPDSPSIVCFVTGTLIQTTRGDVAVEDLAVGDLTVTASGAQRPIRWIGSRTIDCTRHPRPAEILPVRIAAGAFAENRPSRDLLVSPGHSLCFDVLGEVLIPASSLVNGTTITHQDVETVTYWHVQLDSHDILIANGQPAESYLDMGNRSFFADGDVVALDATPDADAAARTHADFCRPFHAGGALVDAVRGQVQARAERLGWRHDDAPWADMHMMVDGERIDADTHGLGARFVLPASAKDVWLISQTSVPCEVSSNPDPRRLGLCIQGITIDDGVGDKRSVALDDPLLCLGFHDCEEGVRRWTAGRSRLPAALFDGCRGTVFLRIELVRHALPRWVAPEAAVAVETMRGAPLLSLVAA
ncbi:Hint domain-containing protein [Methylobacterium sp. WL9]|uniref:Hint domain-containing protein n=1 Tax=Methylobacterium sp. WL9 TaxID=2603898 RepID=UPI0016505622|nr:Hint domain-containing protein [Methylobacterium sp. WL9]